MNAKILIGLLLCSACISFAASLELKSPDDKVALHFDLKNFGSEKACPIYNVSYAGHPVLADSRLGLQLRDFLLVREFEIISQKISSNDTTWKPVAGERATIRDHYNQLVVELRAIGSANRLMLTFRAYDEGVAFNYTLPRENGMSFDITNEVTQFAFTGDHPAWAVYTAQADYTKSLMPLSKIQPGAERPLTVREAEGIIAALEGAAEAMVLGSGMSAATAVFLALRPGDHVIAPEVMYWGLRHWLLHEATEWGLRIDLVVQSDVVDHRYRGGRGRGACRGGTRGGGLDLRHPGADPPAGTGGRPGDAFGDQVSQWPFRRDRRRAGDAGEGRVLDTDPAQPQHPGADPGAAGGLHADPRHAHVASAGEGGL